MVCLNNKNESKMCNFIVERVFLNKDNLKTLIIESIVEKKVTSKDLTKDDNANYNNHISI